MGRKGRRGSGRRKSSGGQTRKKPRAYIRGIIEINRAGYGFVKTAEGEFFVQRSKIGGAFDGDLVEIVRSGSHHNGRKSYGKPGEAGGDLRPEARVVRVVERAHASIIGRYEIAEPFGIVVPDDPRIPHDIFTLIEDHPGIEDGSLVRVRITEYPTRRSACLGVVEEVLGNADDESLSVERIVARHKLHTVFSDDALAEADAAVLDVEGALKGGYRDLRDRFIFTIDPADAKDFDDAISVDRLGDSDETEADATGETAQFIARDGTRKRATWRLGVHIADVGHYVPWGSSIDIDARKRATSVYLADRVIPMLPEALSNELCSLKPNEDRRSVTVDIYLDDESNLVDYDIYPAIIRSKKRLSYDEALSMLESTNDGEASEELAAEAQLLMRLRKAHEISEQREAARKKTGGIEFETKEPKVRLDEHGKPIAIEVRQKNAATALIEEAMIFANEVVARHLTERGIPAAYRTHDRPDEQALAALVPVFQEFSWFTTAMAQGLPTGNPHIIQKILDAAHGRIEAELVTMLLLRSMMRAIYSPADSGHYGLGLSAYCHFTSPIRRYPDLIVHRALHSTFPNASPTKGQNAQLPYLCEHSSEMERVAEYASRDSVEAKIVEFMAPHVGEEFDAIVSGVTTYGIYVRLDNCAEGLVPVRSLGAEYFAYDAVRHMLKGTETGKTFRLGQKLRVTLKSADTQLSQLDFILVK